MQINKNLKLLYEKEMEHLLEKKDFPNNIDGPLLMYCWEEEYLSSDYKILFIGRESNGWMGDLHLNVDDCIDRYKNFELCENGKYTTFWQYIYNIKNILMPNTIGKRNFLWSNTSKFSKAKEGSAVDLDDFKFFSNNFNVLENEIQITKPDVIIFFTGKEWDDKIQHQIEDKIKFNALSMEIETSELARLTAKPFPLHTYRVAHPITLQTQRKWHYIEKIIKNIKSIKKPIKRKYIDIEKLTKSLSENLDNLCKFKTDLIHRNKYEQSVRINQIEKAIKNSIDELNKMK